MTARHGRRRAVVPEDQVSVTDIAAITGEPESALLGEALPVTVLSIFWRRATPALRSAILRVVSYVTDSRDDRAAIVPVPMSELRAAQELGAVVAAFRQLPHAKRQLVLGLIDRLLHPLPASSRRRNARTTRRSHLGRANR